MPSIKQNPAGLPVPDFRNFGVMLRVLLGVNLMAFAVALGQGGGLSDAVQRFAEQAAWVQPVLLFDLCLLALCHAPLQRLPVRLAQAAILALAGVSTGLYAELWVGLGLIPAGLDARLRVMFSGMLPAAALLLYFELRARAFSPALSEARLQALTARIRPHFLFNSLNAVLALIRSEPRRAEAALEELAELFRALMRDHRELLPLADEIALCRQYLALESLRLGERLQVEWALDAMPASLLVPPLMLQPLLENAVYHGIEPLGQPGLLSIRCVREGDTLRLDVTNPLPPPGGRAGRPGGPAGSHMALDNIRERLALYYDLEARLETQEATRADGLREFRVRIVLPSRSLARD